MPNTQVAELDQLLPDAVKPPVAPAQPAGIVPSSDDRIKNDFVSGRTAAQQGNPARDLDSLLAPAAPGGAPPADGAPASAPGAAPPAPTPPPQPIGRRILSGLAAVGSDIAGGLAGTPKHIVGGLLDSVNNLNDLIADATAKLPGPYLQLFNAKGEYDPRVMSEGEGRAQQLADREARARGEAHGITYNMSHPDTVTGDIMRTAVSFLAARKAIAGNPTSMVGNVGADIVAGAASMSPNQARLSNVIDSVAPNFVTNFLKAKPEDEGTMLGHLKSGLEMGGLGALVHGAVKTVKALKATMGAGDAAAEGGAEGATAAPAASADAAAPEAQPAAVGGLQPAMAGAGGQGGGALDRLLSMQSDMPWNTGGAPAGEAATPGAAGGAKASGGVGSAPDPAARDFLAANGYPKAETGLPLSAPAEDAATVTVSPELKTNFDRFMAQERGEAAAPLDVNGKPLAQQGSADFSATGGNPVKVNLNMINGPDDLKDAIARVSSQIPAQAIRHNDAVIDAANAVGMTAEDFMAGPGGALNDSEVVAMRMVANDTARQYLDLAKQASLPGAGDEVKAQALAAYSKFNGILSYMEAAKAESGRSVQAWGIPVAGMRVPYADAVKKLAAVAGDPESAEFMARMGALDGPEQVASAAQAARSMTTRDWMLYGYYNALLSYKTVAKKAISDAGMAMWNVATRYAAEKLGSGAVQPGETAALIQGYTGSFGDSLKVALAGLKAGRSQFGGENVMDAFDRTTALGEGGAEALPNSSPTWAMREYLRAALPTSWIGAFDDFATSSSYLAEKNALAYRNASSKGLTGVDLENAVSTLTNNPPTWLHGQAKAAALANTFKEPLTGIAATMNQLVDDMNIPIGLMGRVSFELPVGRILAPFVKIPINITRWSYSNSPLPLIMPSSRISAELAAGGATRDLALAKIGLGTALSTSFLGLTLGGRITGKGPSDPQLQAAWKAAGNKPHWFNPTGKPDGGFGYNSMEPFGLMAGIIADTHDIMRFAKEEDSGQAALSLVFGAGQALMSKTYMEGTAEFLKAMENPDKEAKPYFDRMVSSAAVPNVIKGFRDAIDPWARQHYDMLQAMEARLPFRVPGLLGKSQDLPPQRTLWGDAVPLADGYAPFLTGTGAARMLSPIPVRSPAEDAQPIDKWIFENRMAFPRGPDNKLGISKPALIQNFSGGPNVATQIELTPQQHDRLQVLAGNELKDPSTGLGARDTLNALVEGHGPDSTQRQWDNAPAAVKALIVGTTINKFRGAAKQQLIHEFPDLEDAVRAGFQSRAAQLQPQ